MREEYLNALEQAGQDRTNALTAVTRLRLENKPKKTNRRFLKSTGVIC